MRNGIGRGLFAVALLVLSACVGCRPDDDDAIEVAQRSVGYDIHACRASEVVDHAAPDTLHRYFVVSMQCRMRSQPELGEHTVYYRVDFMRVAGNAWTPDAWRVPQAALPLDYRREPPQVEVPNHALVWIVVALLGAVLIAVLAAMLAKKPDYPQVARRVKVEFKPTKAAQSRNPYTLPGPYD